MNIMISINRDYIKYACIMLMSLKEHHKDILLSVYILHNELTDEDFQQMDEIVGSEGIELIPVFIPEGTVRDFQIGDWPEVCAYRLLVTDLFGGTLDRILHLDVDILITGDISELYNTAFEDNYLIGCEDFLSEADRRQKCREVARDDNTTFFNSGVLLFNIPKLLADGFCYSVYVDILKRYPHIRIEYPDQDMLNLLFCDKTKYMNRIKYNYSPLYYSMNDTEYSYNSLEELKRNCSIVHMISGTKPWVNASKTAVDELWWEYARRTPFYADMKKEHVRAMLRREQRLNDLIDSRIKEIGQHAAASQDMSEVEELFYQILERDFAIVEKIGRML